VGLKAINTKILSEDERRMIVGICIVGMSIHCIAAELGMTQSMVFLVWKNFQECRTIQLLKSSGRPPKLNVHDKRILGCVPFKNGCLPLAAIRNKIYIKVFPTQLRKAKKSIGFSNRVATKKPFLSQEHKARRLAFAKKYYLTIFN